MEQIFIKHPFQAAKKYQLFALWKNAAWVCTLHPVSPESTNGPHRFGSIPAWNNAGDPKSA